MEFCTRSWGKWAGEANFEIMEQKQKWVNTTFFNTDFIQNKDVAMEKGFLLLFWSYKSTQLENLKC